MRVIVRNGQTYARHWFRWYWVLAGVFYSVKFNPKEEE